MGDDFERVLCHKREVFVFRLPPKTSNRGYRASDWTLDNPDWSGKLRITTLNNKLKIKIEDSNSGQLFAECPLDSYPNPSIEPVIDSSRYFVIRIQEDTGRSAFIGIGFADRSDSFDMLVTLQDHFKGVLRDEKIEEEKNEPEREKLDLSFKQGQTIKLNLSTKSSSNPKTCRPKGTGLSLGSGGLLPPPPRLSMGSQVQEPIKSVPEPIKSVPEPIKTVHELIKPAQPTPSTNIPPTSSSIDDWGDFTSSSDKSNNESKAATSWVDFN